MEKYFDIRELQVRFGKSHPWFRAAARDFGFPPPVAKAGNRLLWDRAQVEAWAAAHPEPQRRVVALTGGRTVA